MTLPEKDMFEPAIELLVSQELRLTAQQQAYATLAVATLVDTVGLNRAEVRIVIDESIETKNVVAIDASPNGQYVGLFSDILNRRAENPSWYTVEVAGRTIDLLSGCTRGVYLAMIADARNRGERFLPDSLALNQHNGHIWTATMLTGEALDEQGKVWIASSSSHDKVNFVGQNISRGGKSFRVRPSIPIGQIHV